MNKTAREQEIIDYLYGELDAAEQQLFEAELKRDSQLQEEVERIKSTLGMLSNLEDQEVIEPDLSRLFEPGNKQRIPSIAWASLSVAASIALLMLVGYMTNFSASYIDGNFNLAFDTSSEQQQPQDFLTAAQVNSLIENRLKEESGKWNENFLAVSTELKKQLEESRAVQKEQFARLASQEKQVPDEQILNFVEQLQEANRDQLTVFFEASARDQEQYMQMVLTEFSKYLQDQRKEDIQMLQANFLEMKTSSEEKQRETEKILASIITTVYNQNNNSIGR